MPTIRWSDVDYMEAAGTIRFQDMELAVGSSQIARWKDDPDGRFGLAVVAQPSGSKTAELVKFYPSL